MMRNLHVRLLALGLLILGLALFAYKWLVLGLPVVPHADAQVWAVQAQLEFAGRQQPAKVALQLPAQPPGFVVIDEDFVSSNFGLVLEQENGARVANWTVRDVSGKQVLYYRMTVARSSHVEFDAGAPPEFVRKPVYPKPLGAAVEAVLADARRQSADIESFSQRLLQTLNTPPYTDNVKLLRGESTAEPGAWMARIQSILAGARISSRVLWGIKLTESRNNAVLEPWLQVHNGQQWLTFEPYTGLVADLADVLLWSKSAAGGQWLQSQGVSRPQLNLSVSETQRQVVQVARQRAQQRDAAFMAFSLFDLPINTQNVYGVLIMVPLGALLMVFLRNVVGLRTFGTFMPILIGLSFRETQLFWGVVLFSLIVALGLSIRFYLQRLMLLLVPRLAAVLTIVVMLMLAVSLFSHEMQLSIGLSVALFPMVILALTIERMSLIWEEHGPAEAMVQGVGSLVVASIGYLVMSNDWLSHLMFVFPELLLVVLAMTLAMGRYTGYRLSELWRFRAATLPATTVPQVSQAPQAPAVIKA